MYTAKQSSQSIKLQFGWSFVTEVRCGWRIGPESKRSMLSKVESSEWHRKVSCTHYRPNQKSQCVLRFASSTGQAMWSIFQESTERCMKGKRLHGYPQETWEDSADNTGAMLLVFKNWERPSFNQEVWRWRFRKTKYRSQTIDQRRKKRGYSSV